MPDKLNNILCKRLCVKMRKHYLKMKWHKIGIH